jgi:hypothetical protein
MITSRAFGGEHGSSFGSVLKLHRQELGQAGQ